MFKEAGVISREGKEMRFLVCNISPVNFPLNLAKAQSRVASSRDLNPRLSSHVQSRRVPLFPRPLRVRVT